MHVDHVVAHGRGRAELTAAVRAQIGFLLFKTSLKMLQILIIIFIINYSLTLSDIEYEIAVHLITTIE